MTMTKQDFELVEAAIKEVYVVQTSTDARAAFKDLVTVLSHRFKKLNPRFDPKRFVQGCGLPLS